MKAERLNGDFNPVVLTLETQEEYDFLEGLLDGAHVMKKNECDHYDDKMCDKMFDLLDDLK